MSKTNDTIKTGSNTSTDNANKARSQAPKETPEVPNESLPSVGSEVPENANTDEREPFFIKDGVKNFEALRPEFVQFIRVEYPKAMAHNGLKTVQQAITGTKGQVDDSVHKEIKIVHQLLRKIGKEDAQAFLNDAGHALVSKNVRTFNDITRTGRRDVRIDLKTDIEYISN